MNQTPPTQPFNQDQSGLQIGIETPQGNNLNKALIILVAIFVVLSVSAGGYYILRIKQIKQPTTPPTQLPKTSQTIVPSLKPAEISWQEKSSDLYKFALSLPSNWTFQEVNRRPEPTGPGDPVTGHDCAEYLVKSNDGYMKIQIVPICGFADGGPDMTEEEVTIVQDRGEKTLVRRFKNGVYEYGTGGGEAEMANSDGTTSRVKLYTSIVIFKNTFAYVTATYSGSSDTLDQYLPIADKVVISLKDN